MRQFKIKYIIFFLVTITLLSGSCNSSSSKKKIPLAINGVLDLTNWDFKKNGIIKLDGEWNFYWNRLLTPGNFSEKKIIKKSCVIPVPGYWNKYKIDNKSLYKKGFATYRLKIKIKNVDKVYALKLMQMNTAYKLWINDKLIAQNGKVGKNIEDMTPQFLPKTASFYTTNSTIDVILQISNFISINGGVNYSIQFGEESQIHEEQDKNLAFELFLFGCLFIIAFYHIGLYLLRKKNKSILYFGVFCFLIAIRTILMGERFFIKLFPDFSWNMALKIELICFYIGVPVFLMFIKELYPEELSKKILNALQITGIIFTLFVIVTPAIIYSYSLFYYEIITLIFIVYLIYILSLALIRKRDGILLVIGGSLIVVSATANDIFFTLGMINTGYYAPFGLLIFILIQSFLLSIRFSKAFKIVEIQSVELNTIKNHLNNIIDSMPSALIGIDINKKVTQWNSETEKFTGILEKDVLGKPINEVLPDFIDQIEKTTKSFKKKEFVKIERIKYEKENINYYLDIMIYPLIENEIYGAVIRIDDVTELEKIESEMRQTQKMETVGTLAGGLAHDFNNVLGGLMGTLSIITFQRKNKKSISNEKLDAYLEIIQESGERATDMVKQLLTLSRKQELSFTTVDLNISIKNIIKICNNSIDKSIKLKPIYQKKPVLINADPTQIEQVILNFCINAGHAMTIMKKKEEKWGGILTISIEKISADKYFKKIHLDAKEANYWMVSVKDTGIGMEKEIISKIFNPFFTTKETGKGTGLGLSMVYNIIKQHSGFIDVYSEVGLGSTFNIYLPVIEGENKPEKNNEETEIIHKGEGLILVVDDEKIMRDTAKEILVECGYDVIFAKNGKEGVDLFEKEYSKIKIVILDMAMPEMSGSEAYIKMKNINPELKVLIASGFRQDERVQKVLNLGANGFIQKPYTLERLIKKIKKII